MKTLIRLREGAGCSESSLDSTVQKYNYSNCESFVFPFEGLVTITSMCLLKNIISRVRDWGMFVLVRKTNRETGFAFLLKRCLL